jgi:GDP-L-fucose synthase
VEWVAADLTRVEDCRRAVEGAREVIHCAAASSGAAVIVGNPVAHLTPNVVMNAQLLEAAWAAGVQRFVFLSSSVVYPDVGARPVGEGEAFAGEPHPVYHAVGCMKRFSEQLCELYARRLARRMPVVVIRPANVYGPGDKFDLATCHVTSALIRKVVERRHPLEVWGTGDDRRDLIFIDDFVDGVVAARAVRDDFLAVNLCSGRSVSVRELLATILEVDGWPDADVRLAPGRPRTIPARVLDGTLARERLGFVARTPLAEGVRRTLAWYRSRHVASEERGILHA